MPALLGPSERAKGRQAGRLQGGASDWLKIWKCRSASFWRLLHCGFHLITCTCCIYKTFWTCLCTHDLLCMLCVHNNIYAVVYMLSAQSLLYMVYMRGHRVFAYARPTLCVLHTWPTDFCVHKAHFKARGTL
jgi:hypothetical protein